MSSRPIVSFSRTPTITSLKLIGKNYLLWSTSVEMWFLGTLTMITLNKMEVMCLLTKLNNGSKLIINFFPYCGSPWNLNYWVHLDLLRLATLSGKRVKIFFASDIQHPYEACL